MGLGVVLLPIPVPVSIPLVGAGLRVLGQEYEAAKEAEGKLLESIDAAKAAVQEQVETAKTKFDEFNDERRGRLENQDGNGNGGGDGAMVFLRSFSPELFLSEQNRLMSDFGRAPARRNSSAATVAANRLIRV